jgi:acyl carrier protein
MLTEQAIQGIILRALDNLNEELDAESKIAVSTDTRLFGADAALDSLSLVSVIVDVETEISTEAGRQITLTDDRAMIREVSPFADVRALTAYVVELLAETAE